VLACQEDFALELVGIEYDLESSVCPWNVTSLASCYCFISIFLVLSLTSQTHNLSWECVWNDIFVLVDVCNFINAESGDRMVGIPGSYSGGPYFDVLENTGSCTWDPLFLLAQWNWWDIPYIIPLLYLAHTYRFWSV
jgi:hypothetical protein